MTMSKHVWRHFPSTSFAGNYPTDPVTVCETCGEEFDGENKDAECSDDNPYLPADYTKKYVVGQWVAQCEVTAPPKQENYGADGDGGW